MALKISPQLESTIARRAKARGVTPEVYLLSLIGRTYAGESDLDSLQPATSALHDACESSYGLWKRNGHQVDVEQYLDNLRNEWH